MQCWLCGNNRMDELTIDSGSFIRRCRPEAKAYWEIWRSQGMVVCLSVSSLGDLKAYIQLLLWYQKYNVWQLLLLFSSLINYFFSKICSEIWQAWCLYWEKKKEECCKGPQIHAISQVQRQWAVKLTVSQVLVASEVYIFPSSFVMVVNIYTLWGQLGWPFFGFFGHRMLLSGVVLLFMVSQNKNKKRRKEPSFWLFVTAF